MRRPVHLPKIVSLLGFLLVGVCRPAAGIETVLVNLDGNDRVLKGAVVVEDRVGSMLLETDEGALWPIMANTIRTRQSSDDVLEHLDKEGLGERLLEELGPGFRIHHSKHYVVAYNTTLKYAQWSSSLLEKLQNGFLGYFKKMKCEIHEPEHPLAVVIFGDKPAYISYAKEELGKAAGSAIGFYSLKTNRISMYDLTGMQSLYRESSRRGRLQDIRELLSQPEAVPLVATIIHEATHQIAFNCGLQKRFAPNPVWLGEGLAMYCETPELTAGRSWRGIGNVNYDRWDRYRDNADAGRLGTLEEMIASDARFRNPRTAVDAYAEAWAWTYFLAKWHEQEFVAYLKLLAAKPVLTIDDEKTRMQDFTQHFGKDLRALEDEFYRRMSRID